MPGDLIVIEEKDIKTQEEKVKIFIMMMISFVDATLGSSIEIPTLTGKSKIKIEPGTRMEKYLDCIVWSSQIQGYGKGDLFVHIHVYPTKLSKDEKLLLSHLERKTLTHQKILMQKVSFLK